MVVALYYELGTTGLVLYVFIRNHKPLLPSLSLSFTKSMADTDEIMKRSIIPAKAFVAVAAPFETSLLAPYEKTVQYC